MNNLERILDTIIVGDVLSTRRTIPDESIDVTVTSPPYNKRNKSQGWLVTNEKYTHFNDQMPEDKYQTWQVQVLNELLRVTKPGGSLFYGSTSVLCGTQIGLAAYSQQFLVAQAVSLSWSHK